ncbi:hypothetical protein [Pseudomonas sp. NPDC088890]|uniref:hypothetical protein n=1 Tax=Pseudomonas sp. NPDC088890 TaxID=3364458 RepID=UPI00384A470D
MRWRGAVWLLLVFSVTLLAELPARWLTHGLAISGVSGSLWRGQAVQWGPAGPLRWEITGWPLQAQLLLGFQGQGWQARLSGWPWSWQAELQALSGQARVATGYRLAGQWQGTLRMQGEGARCSRAEGRIATEDLALVEPWSLGLGRGSMQMDCSSGWHLHGQLNQPGQHQLELDADLSARRAKVDFQLQTDAALTPILRALQWLGPTERTGQRKVGW